MFLLLSSKNIHVCGTRAFWLVFHSNLLHFLQMCYLGSWVKQQIQYICIHIYTDLFLISRHHLILFNLQRIYFVLMETQNNSVFYHLINMFRVTLTVFVSSVSVLFFFFFWLGEICYIKFHIIFIYLFNSTVFTNIYNV